MAGHKIQSLGTLAIFVAFVLISNHKEHKGMYLGQSG